jgi:mono/diheme cytochrome c family protein
MKAAIGNSNPREYHTDLPRAGQKWTAGLAGAIVLTLFGLVWVFGCEQGRANKPLPTAAKSGETARPAGEAPLVTPVSGRSWLHELGLSLDETRMGQMGGASPPSRTARREPLPAVDRSPSGPLGSLLRHFYALLPDQGRASEALNEPFVLTGADLYRLNCQSCHGPDGTGSPPEINSLIGPVQGTSPALIQQRMKERGQPIDEAFARQLAAEGDKPLRERLVKGGEKMPPFTHLAGKEVDALLLYLKQLAGVPEAQEADLRVTQSVARVGEHLVEGTCHICHDATGPGSGHMMMMRGIIPSLASFPEQKSLGDVSRKVFYGSAGTMGMMGGDRMPTFPYLTEEEVAAGYVYLATHPPRP